MKVNLNRPFLDYRHNPIGNENEKMKDLLCVRLFSASTCGENPMSAEQKYTAYKLCNKINDRPDEVEMDRDERKLLLDICAESLSAGAYGQLADLLDGSEN